MNAEDKMEYYDNLIKNMTRKCHTNCFKTQNFKIDQMCLSSCYHKYLNVISSIRNLAINHGDNEDSEYIHTIFNPRHDIVMDLIWSKGGSKFMHVPPVTLNLRHEVGKIYPFKGYSPYRDQFENQ
jgi:hypothetical protein